MFDPIVTFVLMLTSFTWGFLLRFSLLEPVEREWNKWNYLKSSLILGFSISLIFSLIGSVLICDLHSQKVLITSAALLIFFDSPIVIGWFKTGRKYSNLMFLTGFYVSTVAQSWVTYSIYLSITNGVFPINGITDFYLFTLGYSFIFLLTTKGIEVKNIFVWIISVSGSFLTLENIIKMLHETSFVSTEFQVLFALSLVISLIVVKYTKRMEE